MALNEKEKTTIKDLQTQEQTCIKKYKKYGQDAKDPVLKELFSTLEKNEQKHYDTLGQILEGKVPECDCNDCEGKEYEPEATYDVMSKSEDKESDAFLATDSIGSEKLVSGEYNTNVFNFADTANDFIPHTLSLFTSGNGKVIFCKSLLFPCTHNATT